MFLVARLALIGFGLAVLLFGIGSLLAPRARYVNSNPAAGEATTEPPSAVIIRFSNKLAPESQMDVTSTIRLLPSGEFDYLNGSSVVASSGIDAGDASGRSLRANLRPNLHRLYWISWRTTTARWRTVTYGKTVFGVGMPVTPYLTADRSEAIYERSYNWRGRRAAIIGGVIMIVLAFFLPWGRT
jgi:hypothetical protein